MNRRKFLAGGVAVAAVWNKPVLQSVVLPAHAQTSIDAAPEAPEPPCGGDLQPPCDPIPQQRCEVIDDTSVADPTSPDYEGPSLHCQQCEQLADDSRQALSRGDQDASEALESRYAECDCQIYTTDLGDFCPQLDPL